VVYKSDPFPCTRSQNGWWVWPPCIDIRLGDNVALTFSNVAVVLSLSSEFAHLCRVLLALARMLIRFSRAKKEMWASGGAPALSDTRDGVSWHFYPTTRAWSLAPLSCCLCPATRSFLLHLWSAPGAHRGFKRSAHVQPRAFHAGLRTCSPLWIDHTTTHHRTIQSQRLFNSIYSNQHVTATAFFCVCVCVCVTMWPAVVRSDQSESGVIYSSTCWMC
jgi:hypothetical protein